jgi:hypothetical protein
MSKLSGVYADMCPALRDVIYRVIGSITIKYNSELMQYVGLNYDTDVKLVLKIK